jgi:hypothetical protein
MLGGVPYEKVVIISLNLDYYKGEYGVMHLMAARSADQCGRSVHS